MRMRYQNRAGTMSAPPATVQSGFMNMRAAHSKKDIVLSAQGISKSYEVDVKPAAVFLERLFGLKGRRKLFEALKPLDLEIRLGQSIGILGRNGAGKSTLLGVLSGVFKPTTGRVDAFGRIAALIGVGQSFNIDLTGRENAFRFCRIQGLSGAAAKEAVERIAEFSELGGHFDLALKTYSSGMKARLNFACATSVSAELIIVDEVLAVGDAEFRSKCYGHMEASIANGQTYIMVSHSPAIIGNYCDRVLVLDHGELKFDGDPLGAMQAYDALLKVNSRKKRSLHDLMEMRRNSADGLAASHIVELTSVALRAAEGADFFDGRALVANLGRVRVCAEFMVHADIERPRVGCGFRNGKGLVVAATSHQLQNDGWRAGEIRRVEFEFVPRLTVGAYLLRLSVADFAKGEKNLVFDKEGAIEIHIVEGARTGMVDIGFAFVEERLVAQPGVASGQS